MITIYGLTDGVAQIRYVGQTRHIHARFAVHQKMITTFVVEGFALLETVVTQKAADRAEVKWIAFFGRDNLCNKNNGTIRRGHPQDGVRLCIRITPVLAAALQRDMARSQGEDDISRIVRRILSAHYFNRRPRRTV